MIACPQCGNQNEDGAAFCDNCGTALPGAGVPPTPAAGLPPTAAVGGGLNCPQCGQAVVAGEAFCENCGAALSGVAPMPPQPAPPPSYQPPVQQPPTPQPVAPPQPPPLAPAPAVTCPSCGAPATPGAAFCDNCGASLTATPPQPPHPGVQTPPQPVSYPTPGPMPRLVVQPSNAPLPFPPGKLEIIAGREDPVSNVFPEIDLDPHGGDEGGVSRRHAKFTQRAGQWYVEDLNSTNFTFVNKQKLQPGQAQPLNNGDEVRFGRVTLTFYTS